MAKEQLDFPQGTPVFPATSVDNHFKQKTLKNELLIQSVM